MNAPKLKLRYDMRNVEKKRVLILGNGDSMQFSAMLRDNPMKFAGFPVGFTEKSCKYYKKFGKLFMKNCDVTILT